MKKTFWVFLFFLAVNAKAQMDTVLIKQLMEANPSWFSVVLNDSTHKQVQILYTQINRDKNNFPHFKSFSYRLNTQHYFYPASTVKLPESIFALEKINALQIKGLDKNSVMMTDSTRKEQTKVLKDATAENGLPSVAQYIKKILLVSDNDAFNRLYEFVGRAETNQKLHEHGLTNSRILNRLNIKDGGENARHTNPITFYNNGKIIYQQPAQYDPKDYPLPLTNTAMGIGYMDSSDQLVNKPFDLSGRNVYPLVDQQLLMKKLVFPEAFPVAEQFKLTAADYDFLYRYMSMYPPESKFPTYDTASFYPAFGKFLFYGQRKDAIIHPNIRIFNKIGDSYGFTIDNTYFVDYQNKVEFLLAAVVQSNNDGIYNDDKYEYETVCFPFLEHLGQTIYEYELKRKKQVLPDLKKFEKYR
jgi:hypothetical protein